MRGRSPLGRRGPLDGRGRFVRGHIDRPARYLTRLRQEYKRLQLAAEARGAEEARQVGAEVAESNWGQAG